MKYNPLVSPNKDAWLQMDEAERIDSVMKYHKKARIKLPDARLHAVFHVIVENQLAEGLQEVQDALERLQNDNLDRHNAIHAIGTILTKYLYDVMNNPEAFSIMGAPTHAYLEDLKTLTKESWLREIGYDDSDD